MADLRVPEPANHISWQRAVHSDWSMSQSVLEQQLLCLGPFQRLCFKCVLSCEQLGFTRFGLVLLCRNQVITLAIPPPPSSVYRSVHVRGLTSRRWRRDEMQRGRGVRGEEGDIFSDEEQIDPTLLCTWETNR